jgi:hypothetical protein
MYAHTHTQTNKNTQGKHGSTRHALAVFQQVSALSRMAMILHFFLKKNI